ncbi:MAG TPA: YceI family protein [Acidimicrobiales bacterium]|jgi:polyisoprenoid-binding protein YceI|nr:YceI family protein [Acidimicrobiales bacterium]
MTIENSGNVGQAARPRGGHPVPTGRYRLHPELSMVAFTAKKFGVFTIRGTVRVESGTFTVAGPLEHSTLHAVLAADSFKTPMAKRDEHVKGPKLMDVATYPRIEFDSTEVVPGPEGTWQIRGLLAVHGKVAPASLTVTSASADGALLRVHATARVDRRAFGVTAMRAAASSVIELEIEVVGTPVR